MPNRFRSLLYHLRHVIFPFYAHHLLHLSFHLFNIAPNVLVIILIRLVIIVLILILILLIHLIVTHINHLNHTFTPKHILTLIGNLTPGSLISAVLSRPWDGSVLVDTIFSFCYYFIFLFHLIFFRYPAFFRSSVFFVLQRRGRRQKEGAGWNSGA